jgi:hypothetical protein
MADSRSSSTNSSIEKLSGGSSTLVGATEAMLFAAARPPGNCAEVTLDDVTSPGAPSTTLAP